MKFAREGYVVAAVPALAAVLAGVGWGVPVAAALTVLAVAALLFFRDPERTPAGDDASLIAPADGRVVAVEDLPAGHPLAAEAKRRIALFMSPVDVPGNRSPVAAGVARVAPPRGTFRSAYSSTAV